MKILSILTQSKEEKEQKAALRIAKALRRGQEALIDKLEGEKDEHQTTIDSLKEVSLKTVDTKTWNAKYQDAIVELALIDKRIEIANATNKELFTDVMEA